MMSTISILMNVVANDSCSSSREQ